MYKVNVHGREIQSRKYSRYSIQTKSLSISEDYSDYRFNPYNAEIFLYIYVMGLLPLQSYNYFSAGTEFRCHNLTSTNSDL